MAGIVSGESNERATYIIEDMPLRVVYAYEHLYYLKNGYSCKVKSYEHSLEDLMRNV